MERKRWCLRGRVKFPVKIRYRANGVSDYPELGKMAESVEKNRGVRTGCERHLINNMDISDTAVPRSGEYNK